MLPVSKTLLGISLVSSFLFAQPYPPQPFIAMGDSIGEGVQSADANFATQPNSYLELIAKRMGVPFRLPLIRTSPTASIFSTNMRGRINGSVVSPNLAVSGADTGSVLTDAADGTTATETDLVLGPRLGTQTDIATATPSALMVYWLGSNDALGAILSFDHLDASQLTSVPDFYSHVDTALSRLKASGKTRVVLANLLSIPNIAFTLDNQQLKAFAGSAYGLPDGYRTTVVAALLLRMGLAGPRLLQNPDWVLDPTEIATIQQRLNAFNFIIAERAAFYGYPVVDVKGAYDRFLQNPPIIAGVMVTNNVNGGLFSLDSVHPSNTGHALLANEFIAVINQTYGFHIPPFSQTELDAIGLNDPFLDLNGNGVVRGRFGFGILETLGPSLGLSGDTETAAVRSVPASDAGYRFLAEYHRRRGMTSAQGTPFEQAVRAFHELLPAKF
jgi:phospholipase/lecithinase/hemolysin